MLKIKELQSKAAVFGALIMLLIMGADVARSQIATLNISSPSVTEGNSGTKILTFNITCDPCGSVNAIVDWSTADGTATTADNDYVAKSGQIDDFGNGSAIETYPIQVTINGDTNLEADETFELKITNASVGLPSLVINSPGIGTILNDDVANQPPDCSGAAIADQTVDASCKATISGSDVTGVTDPDGDPLTITVSPTNLVMGANPVTVTADDGNGGVSSCNITVTVLGDPCCKDEPLGFMYSAKLICGVQKDPENLILARGLYATAINIHNPNYSKITFCKKLALTFPPEDQKPGKVIRIATDVLGPDEALEVDCMDIRKKLFPNGFPAPYIKGFVVIESKASLDVTAVYTTASLDKTGSATNHSSIDVEQIMERKTQGVPPQPPKELDHFKVYEIKKDKANFEVRLAGQFDEKPKAAKLLALTHFANPTSKDNRGSKTGIKNPNGHLNWYRIKQEQPEPRRTIRFRNQFGQHSVDIKDPEFLLVPTQKTSDEGSQFPDSLDHYKCYRVIKDNTVPRLPVVTLKDQFGSQRREQVRKPRFFAVPVTKEVPGVRPPRIMNMDDHLVIYDIPPRPHEQQIQVRDQFGKRALLIIRSVMLAVPTEKQAVVEHED